MSIENDPVQVANIISNFKLSQIVCKSSTVKICLHGRKSIDNYIPTAATAMRNRLKGGELISLTCILF